MTGIICIDKSENMTSFTASNRVRRILGVKKAGHTGTLDPMATGVLPVALSNSTRFIELLPTHNKAYIAQVKLGLTTDTLDITGKVLSQSPVSVSEEQLLCVCQKYRGEIMQVPPMFSAISKNGQRLYDLARQGIEIEREARKINIFSLEVSDFDGENFILSVECSQGTYIRSLCDDIGRDLGCGAVMSSLRRTNANGFDISECITLDELEKAVSENTFSNYIKPVSQCFDCYEKITVTAPQAIRFHNGGELDKNRLRKKYENGVYTVWSPDGDFLGLGEIKPDSECLSVRRVFVDD